MSNAVFESRFGQMIVVERDASGLLGGRWIDAFGSDTFKAVIDFNDEPVASGEFSPRWTITKTQTGSGSSTFGPVVGQGGYGLITTDDAVSDGINAQFGLGVFAPTSNAQIRFSCRFQVSEATLSSYFVGLSVVQTNILGAPASDMIGLRKASATDEAELVIRKGGVESTVPAVMIQDPDQWHTFDFAFDGSNHRLDAAIDGAPTTALASFLNIPIAALLIPSLVFKTGDTAAFTMTTDVLRCIQVGRT